MNEGEKAVLLIDAAYLFKGQQDLTKQSQQDVDYLKLHPELERILNVQFIEKHYFNSVSDPPKAEQNKFHTFLKFAPPSGPKYFVHLYDLKSTTGRCTACNAKFVKKVQKGVDVGIATKMLECVYAKPISSIVLIAGDGDFKDAVLLSLQNKKNVYVVGFQNKTMSGELQSLATKVLWFGSDIKWESVSKDIKKPPTEPKTKEQKRFFVEALYDFSSPYPNSISFHQGDVMTVLDSSREDWWFASRGNFQGWIPSHYVNELHSLSSDVDMQHMHQ